MATTTSSSPVGKLLVYLGLALVLVWALTFVVTMFVGTDFHELIFSLWQTWVFAGLALAGFGCFFISLAKRRQ